MVSISAIMPGDKGGVMLQGKIHLQEGREENDQEGLFVVSLYNFQTEEVIQNCDPEFIEFNRETNEFTARVPSSPPGLFDEPAQYYCDLYMRNKSHKIKYGESLGEKIDAEFLGFKTINRRFKTPVIAFPQEDFAEEDAEDRMRKAQEQILRKKYEERQFEQRDQEREERTRLRMLMEEEVKAMKARDDDYDGIIEGFKKQAERSKLSKQSLIKMSEALAASLQKESYSELVRMQEEVDRDSEESKQES